MFEPQKNPPFLTRDQLAYQEGVAFSLRVNHQAITISDLHVRGFTKEGPFDFRITTTSDGVTQVQTFRIPDIPIMLSVIDDDITFSQGQTYVNVELLVNGSAVFQFFSGQVYQGRTLSWPQATTLDKLPGRGQITRVNTADAAAGAEISLTFPSGMISRIIGARVTLVTDANAANRRPHFVFTHSTGAVIHCFGLSDQVANTTVQYCLAPYGTILDELDNGIQLINIPHELWVGDGGTLTTITTNIQAGDNYGVMSLIVERSFITL